MIPFALQPGVIAALLIMLGAYLLALRGPRAQHSAPTPWGRQFAFVLGLFCIFVALSSPLEVLAEEYLFSAHMVQHMLLTMGAAPLILIGIPGWLLEPLARYRTVRTVTRSALFPVICFLVPNLIFGLSHIPWIYELAIYNGMFHIGLHQLYLGTAFLFWWPLLSPAPGLPRISYPLQILYLFLHTVPTGIVGALISLSDRVQYPYYEATPRVWDISPIADQQIAGLLMWVGGITIDLIAMTIVFFAWAAAAESNRDPEQRDSPAPITPTNAASRR